MAVIQETKDWVNLQDPFVKLSTPFVDDRGAIQPLVESGVHSIQMIDSKASTTRANHWHQHDSHYLYVLSGKIEYYYRPVGETASPHCVLVKKGDLIFTPPRVEHALYFLEDSVFLNITTCPRDHESYEADTFRVELINK